jgi:hypothetical protein
VKKSRVLNFEEFLSESNQYRRLDSKYILDNFYEVQNNSILYNAAESDFQGLPWYDAIKRAFPDFKLEGVRKSRIKPGYTWSFSAPSGWTRGSSKRVYRVYRPLEKNSPSEGTSQVTVYDEIILPTKETGEVILNDKESWNKVFKTIYFAQFSGLTGYDSGRSIRHIMELFSTDLQSLYEEGELGVVGVKKNCNPYGGHYRSTLDFIKNLPYGIYDKIKEEFIKKIKEDPAVIQYAISQCQLPNESSEKAFGDSRLYPKNEVLDFYNHIKKEGYVPPPGFEEETEEISGLQGSLSDIGL